MGGKAVTRPLAGDSAFIGGGNHRHIGHGVQLMQAVFHAGERLKGRFQGLNAAVAGVIPLLQLAQGEAAAAQNFLLQACGGKFRCGGNPRGDIFTAGNIDATVFQAVKNQHRTFKAGNPAGDAVQVDLFPRGGNKISVGFQAKHTDQLWAEHRAMLDAHRIHDTAVRIHTDKKIPFADKISQCVCHTRTPSMLSIAKTHMRHAALSRALPSTLIIPESSKFLQAFL